MKKIIWSRVHTMIADIGCTCPFMNVRPTHSHRSKHSSHRLAFMHVVSCALAANHMKSGTRKRPFFRKEPAMAQLKQVILTAQLLISRTILLYKINQIV